MSSENNRLPEFDKVTQWMQALQDRLCAAIERCDGRARFMQEEWLREEGGGGRTRILRDGDAFQQAGIGFSDVSGASMPAAATAHRPELTGAHWRAVGVSLVFHPQNPFVPAVHMNVRHFRAMREDVVVAWWFGGGFDLTPCYAFEEDAVQWHRNARSVCAEHGGDARYLDHKRHCDRYFRLRHRGESRGVGGLFFDDLNAPDFDASFAYVRAVGDGLLPGYLPLVERRRAMSFGARERDFQLYRRGRYVEFNLVWDRGTLFGLQSGGRTESILMSLPPQVRWEYGWRPDPGSPEAALDAFLQPRDWLHLEREPTADPPL